MTVSFGKICMSAILGHALDVSRVAAVNLYVCDIRPCARCT